ncbi:hypothetical protein HMSSN036_13280 [Paenibacillus macerans]|nr:hypothetical protein HMSSN036_13280 [Paenibacillus macerans]
MQTEVLRSGSSRYGRLELLRKLEDKTAVIGVIGLGYVGLPLAVEKRRPATASSALTCKPGKSTC